MAENQQTYKTTIEVETKGGENVELLNRTISTSIGEFDNLNEAISKTQDTLGKLDPQKDAAKFKELSKELSDLKDRLRDTEVQSVRFTEALAAQPGVIGFVGQSLEGLRGTFQVFMANPIIAVLAGIAGAFLALRESLTRTEEGQAKLTKITEGLTKILNGLFAIIEPIAMQLADLVGGLLENEKVMDGLSKTVGVLTGVFTTLFGTLKEVAGFVINTLVNNFKTLIGVAKGAGDVIAGVFTFDWDRIKEGANAAFDAVKEGVKGTVDNVKDLGNGIVTAAVDGFKAGEEQFNKGFKRLTESEKEAAEKAKEEREKREEERLRLLEQAEKTKTDLYLKLQKEREDEISKKEEEFNQSLLENEKKYNEDLAKLKEEAAKVGISNLSDVEALEKAGLGELIELNRDYYDEQKRLRDEFNADILAIDKKYDDLIIAEQKNLTEKEVTALEEAQRVQTEIYLSLLDDRNRELYEKEQKYLEDVSALKDANATEFLLVEENYQRELDKLRKEGASQSDILALEGEYQANLEALKKKSADNLINLETNYREEVKEITTKYDEEAIAKQEEQIAKQREVLDGLTEYRSVEIELQFTRNENAFNREVAAINEREQLLVNAAKMAGDALLANEKLTEEQRVQIINQTNEQISQIEAQASADRLAAQQNRFQQRLAVIDAEEQNLLANINESQRLLLEGVNQAEAQLLSNTQLTEEERNRIKQESEDKRTAIAFQGEQQRELLANEFAERRKEVQLIEDEDKLLRIESELYQLGNTFDRQRELIAEKEALLLEQEGLTEDQRTAIRRAAAEERMAIDQMELEAKAEVQLALFDLIGQFGGFLKQIAGENKKLQIAAVIAEQVAAIGRIIVSTAIANAKAVAASPLTFGQPWVAINTATAAIGIASSIAAGVKAVRDIKNSDKEGASAGSGGGSGLPRPKAPSVSGASNVEIPQVGATADTNQTGSQIAETIAASQASATDKVTSTMQEGKDKPIKAYVVSGDISSQQALDRRTTNSATFG